MKKLPFLLPRLLRALPALLGGLLLPGTPPALAQAPGASAGNIYDWQYATYLGPSQTQQVGAGTLGFGGVATDAAGNTVVGGSYEPTLTFDNDLRVLRTPFPLSSFATQGFVARYTPDGVLDWANDLVGVSGVAAVAADAAGNVYALGSYVTTAVFSNALSLTGGRVFLVKYNRAGTPLWARNVLDSPQGQYSADWQLATDAAGNCAVRADYIGEATIGGQTYRNPSTWVRQPYIVRFSATGTALSTWVGTQTGNDPNFGYTSLLYGLVLAPGGEVYLSGFIYRRSTLDAGNGTAVLAPGPNASVRGFVLKINPAGLAEWVLTANVDDVAITGLAHSATSGYLYATANSTANFLVGGRNVVYNATNAENYILQIRPDGTVKKVMSGGLNGFVPALGLGPNDDLYLGFLAGEPRWGAVRLTPPVANTNRQTIGVIRLDSAGNGLRGWQATGPAVFRQPKMAIDGQGQAVYGGAIIASGTAFQFGSRLVPAPNGFGIFVARTGSRVLGTRPAREVPGLALYPNPARDEVWVQLASPGAAALEIRDALGRLVAQQALAAGQRRVGLPPGLAAGTYLVRVAQGEAVSFRRLSIAP